MTGWQCGGRNNKSFIQWFYRPHLWIFCDMISLIKGLYYFLIYYFTGCLYFPGPCRAWKNTLDLIILPHLLSVRPSIAGCHITVYVCYVIIKHFEYIPEHLQKYHVEITLYTSFRFFCSQLPILAWTKGRSHAKIQAVLSKMKKRPKIRHKTVMLSALQL